MDADKSGEAQAIERLFGRRLEEERKAAGLSQKQLSQKTGIAAAYIVLVEEGRANPTLETMVELARALDAEVWDLLVPAP